jgi:glycosyltransferase involved in cell wall biosynthesis
VAQPQFTVLHSIHTDGPGGAETLVVELATRLDRSRFRSLALVRPGTWISENLSAGGIPTHPLVIRRWYSPRQLLDVVRLIRAEKVDLVHTHLPSQNFYGSVAARLCGIPSIVTYHGPLELEQSSGRARIPLLAARAAATEYVVVSGQMASALRDSGFDNDRINLIYNGVTVEAVANLRSGALRRLLAIDDSVPLAGIVANVRPPKGYDTLIQAARKVVDAIPQARFVSIGQPDPELSPQLESLLRQLDLTRNFTFMGFREDARVLLRDFDVFVMSSVTEGLPFAAVEAMAAGKPSVMTRCGGPEEILEDGIDGYLVPVGDHTALARRIVELMLAPGRAAAMGEAARAKILRDFTVEKMIGRYEALYARLLAR